jgi:hypothetical protein
VQEESHSQGGTQVMTRHSIGPRQATSWLHWPYRNRVHPAFQLEQLLFAHRQDVPAHSGLQVPDPPQPHLPQVDELQSM